MSLCVLNTGLTFRQSPLYAPHQPSQADRPGVKRPLLGGTIPSDVELSVALHSIDRHWTRYTLRKATRKRTLTYADQSFNRTSNCTRARAKHPFGVIKQGVPQDTGLAKNGAQVYALFARTNFYMARKK